MGRAEQAGWLVGWLDKTVEHVSGFLSYISHDFASKATAPSSPPGSRADLTSHPQQWHPQSKTVPDKKARNPANEAECRSGWWSFGKFQLEHNLGSCLLARMHCPPFFRKCPALLMLLIPLASIGLSNSIVCPCLSGAAICLSGKRLSLVGSAVLVWLGGVAYGMQ